MKITYFTLFIIVFPFGINAQIGPVNFLDISVQTAGVTKIESVDIDNDGFSEIITSTTGTSGRLGFYTNLKNNSFSNFNLIEPFELCKGFAIGDFNNDNWKDIVSIGGINNEARIYINNAGSFNPSIIFDSNISIQVNDIVVADFDNNNSDDIVIIGQHSIDFYRNNGSGIFTKEVILSTNTSPLPLECLDLAIADLDNDGDIDLVSAETAGLVTYINDDNAVFTAHYHSVISEIIFLIHPFDIDGDGDIDIIDKNNSNELKWFSNDGSGNMTYVNTLSTLPNLKSITSIDYNNDGLEDLYASYDEHISVFKNDGTHTFNNEITVYQDNNLLMGVVQTANIDNQNGLDYVWSGGTNTIAFHINETLLNIDEMNAENTLFYPNPTNGILHFTNQIEQLKIMNVQGCLLLEISNTSEIDLSSLAEGVYIMIIENSNHFSEHKIIKN